MKLKTFQDMTESSILNYQSRIIDYCSKSIKVEKILKYKIVLKITNSRLQNKKQNST